MRDAKFSYDDIPGFREAMARFSQLINPKPQGEEREKLLLEIQSQPGGRLYKKSEENQTITG